MVSLDVVLEIILVQRRFELNAARLQSLHGVLPLGLEIVASESQLRAQTQRSVVALVQRCLHARQDTKIRRTVWYGLGNVKVVVRLSKIMSICVNL